MVVSLRDVVDALNILSDEHQAFLNKRTGEIVFLTDEEIDAVEAEEPLEEYPEWQRELIQKAEEVLGSEDYEPLPDQFEINEWRIMEQFCWTVKDEELRGLLLRAIRGRGAFRRFKDMIYRYGIEDEWYQYRDRALEEIAVRWLEARGIRCEG